LPELLLAQRDLSAPEDMLGLGLRGGGGPEVGAVPAAAGADGVEQYRLTAR
jgi:hypothetical protein